MILIKDVVKKYKIRKKKELLYAVNNLNIEVKKGEIYGLIGPNGAGKTTTLKMLSTLIIPDEGVIEIDNIDVIKNPDIIKQRIGLLSAEFARSLYWRLTGRQNIEFFANLKDMWQPKERIDELLDLFDLKEWENELIMKYSTGMKQKLAFAVGLLNNPSVLLLDEPLSGLDPVSSHKIKDLIKKKFQNKTIILASHNLFEIEQLCDRIGLINNGKIVLEGSPDELKNNYWNYNKILIHTNKNEAFKNLENTTITDKYIEIETDDIHRSITDIIKIANDSNTKIKEIKTINPSLEDIFIKGIES